MEELIQTYHFNELIDERLRKMIIDSVRSNCLDPEKVFSKLDEVLKANEGYIRNPAAFLYRTFTNLNLQEFKMKEINIEFPTWILGKEFFIGFTGEEVDRYLIGRILVHVIKTRQKDSDYIARTGILHSVDQYCKANNINTWKEVVNLLVTSNTLSGCNIPLEKLRNDIIAELDEWHKLLKEMELNDE